jgi:hypothetical protein
VTIGRSVRPQIRENERDRSAIFHSRRILIKFAAERFAWSSWSQKTFDRRLQGLSIGVLVHSIR